jgi:putative peptidoglycan lipid II flippase
LTTLFQYDEFTVADVGKAAQSLRAYAFGLLAYLFVKILLPAYTSRMDLKTPVRYGVISMIAALLLNVLAIPFAHAGLALATSLGAVINAVLLLKTLIKKSAYQPQRGWFAFLIRVALASVVMAFTLTYFVDSNAWSHWGSTDRVINLMKWITAGILVYLLILFGSGLRIRHLTGTNDKIPAI